MTFREKYKLPLAVVFLVLVTALVFSPVLSNPFSAYDDIHFLTKNANVRSLAPESIKNIFQSDVVGTYVPLTVLSFAVEYYFVGYSPFLYHLDNFLLHIAVVLLVFWLARRMKLPFPAALAGALIFAIHPMKVESVAWISERKDVLYAFFYLGAVHQYLSYIENHRKDCLFYSILLGVFSILSKPMALSLPFILWVFDYYFRRPLSWKAIWDKVPYFCYLLPVSLLTLHVHQYDPLATFSDQICVSIWTFIFYIKKFLIPYPLEIVYYIPGKLAVTNPAIIVSSILLLATVAAVWKFRRHRLAVFAFLYYLGSIFFILNYDLLFFVDFSAADRFMYLPGLGLCFLLADGGYRLYRWAIRKAYWKEVVLILYFSVFLVFGIKTYYHAFLWRNEIVMWNKAIGAYPPKAFLHDIRGTVLYESDHKAEALEEFLMTLKLDPSYDPSYFKIGKIYMDAGNLKKAFDYLTAAIYLGDRKSGALAYVRRGVVNAEMGLMDDALNDFDKGLKLSKMEKMNPTVIYLDRGKVYMLRREYEKALADFNRALRTDPRLAQAYFARGVVYEERGKDGLALEDYKRAVRFGGDPRIFLRVAAVYEKKRDWKNAFRYYSELSRFFPKAGWKNKLEELQRKITDENQ